MAHEPHVVIISETWLHSGILDFEITPPGYKIYRKDRDSRGGGVALLFQESMHVQRSPDIADTECVIAKVFLNDFHLVIAGFYRPPNCDIFFDNLNEFLCTAGTHCKNILLAGDFNAPSVDWSTDFPNALCAAAEPLTDIVLFHGLTQLVKQPTRALNILDLFLVNDHVLKRNPRVDIFEGISDHRMASLTLELNFRLKPSKSQHLIPVYSHASDVDILDALDNEFSKFVCLSESHDGSVHSLWCFFKKLVHNCIDNFVPKKRKYVCETNPWMTRNLVRLGRKLKKVRKQHTVRPSKANSDKLTNLRRQLKNGILKAKDHYQNVSLKNFLESSPDKFWRYLSPKKTHVSDICVDGIMLTDKLRIANALNEYFCSAFTSDDGKIPRISVLDATPPISSLDINEAGVLSLLLGIDVKKSPGVDEIPNAFLRRYAEWCAKYLCIIFNKSLSRAEIPHDWKHAKIIPIPKSEDHSLLSSYRPISLLCTSSKLMEHIIFKHISVFIENNGLCDTRQHGFRRGMSTVTQLLETVHEIAATLDSQGQIDIIFLDFEKAFDRVSHQKLLLKLKPILKNDQLLQWTEAYLTNRRQTVVVDDAKSDSSDVRSGIPQGSVLGPLFFLLFINDIVQHIPVKIRLFADDCILYNEIHSEADQAILNSSLSVIATWCLEWQMSINLRKTVSMTITRKQKSLPFVYSINGHNLSSVTQYKYLGLVITSDLRWSNHVAHIKNKAMKKLGYLRRTLAKSTSNIKLLAYKTFIRPLLEYATPVWGPYTQSNVSEIENIQRKAVRFIFNSYRRHTSVSALLQDANLETLEVRRYRDRLKMLYLIYRQHVKIDRELYIKPCSRRPTRSSHSFKLNEYSCRTNMFKKSFFPRTIHEWNALPENVLQSPTMSSFMHALAHL